MKPAGEFELIAQLCKGLQFSRRVIVGPGDDCAVIASARAPLLLTIDSMVEEVHFDLKWLGAPVLGARALAVNLSDIAAMGGTPHTCVVNLGVRSDLPGDVPRRIYAGLKRAARAAGVDIVGGNVTSSRQLTITIALLGDAGPVILRRDAARVGDAIYVTGTLGDAALGWRILAGQVRATTSAGRFLTARYRAPIARLGAGLKLAALKRRAAAIDISDGLLQDLGHILERSETGAVVQLDALPLSPAYRAVAKDHLDFALTGGEDYELLFCLPPHLTDGQLSRRLGVAVRRIGEIRPRREGLNLRGADGRLVRPSHRGGWDQLLSQTATS
jgi:thiamine-monophosphate kinase